MEPTTCPGLDLDGRDHGLLHVDRIAHGVLRVAGVSRSGRDPGLRLAEIHDPRAERRGHAGAQPDRGGSGAHRRSARLLLGEERHGRTGERGLQPRRLLSRATSERTPEPRWC